MKKIVILLISILVALYALLSFMASHNGEYGAEKLFYKAMKMQSVVAANPEVIPPKLLTDIEGTLKTLLKKYPKTEVAKSAHVTLAEYYTFVKKYNDAASQLDFIITTYPKNQFMLSTAHFLKGRMYEAQKKWPSALNEYQILRDVYTATEVGLQMPLYIAKHYADKGDDAAAKEAYNDAAIFYANLEKKNSGKVIGYFASTLAMQAYMKMENYSKAGAILEEAIMKYMSQRTLMQLLPAVETIYVEKLKSPEKAIALYKKIMTVIPDGQIKQIMQKRIAILEKGGK